MRTGYLLFSAMAAFTVPTIASSQSTPIDAPDVKRIISEGRDVHATVAVPFLANTLITIHKFDDKYFFTPNPVADWSKFNDEMIERCRDSDDISLIRVPLDILMFEEETLDALAAGGDIAKAALSPTPSYGYSVFYRIGNQQAVLLETTISAGTLLRDERVSGVMNLPRNITVLVEDTCSKLSEIGEYAKLLVSLHVQGKTFTSSSFSAEVTLREAVRFELDATRGEAEVDEVTIRSSSSGSGFGLSLGPVSFGSTSGRGSSTRSSTRYRTIDSDWEQRVINRATTDVDIEEICDARACPTDVHKTLRDFLNQYITQAKARVSAQSDASLRLTIDSIPGDKKVTISEELKAKLNTLWDRATSEEAEIDGAKVKKVASDKLQVDGETEWTRNGEQWVPTSFNVNLVNESSLSDQIELTYSKIILSEGDSVSVLAGQQDPFSREPGRYMEMPTLFERVSDPGDWPIKCEVFRLRGDAPKIVKFESPFPFGSVGVSVEDPMGNGETAVVEVPEGYALTGGDCSATQNFGKLDDFKQKESGRWHGPDGRGGWMCRYEVAGNKPIGLRTTATAVGCTLLSAED